MSMYLIIVDDGVEESHIPSAASNYVTLCSMDGDDGNQQTVGYSSKVTCKDCIEMWMVTHTVPRRDLDE
ncbi:unnamed protein product [marine sediment metagenome]|uniref:Uncharacterized protein n=1 Tax=marine sediment metagenome TaxID=412755 RepID=X1EDG7_9ZZZZ